MKELLDSDRVNFLVWRYLLESNYRETAAKLQKEWNIQQPHYHFGFAPHVKRYALVTTLNNGLVYQDLKRQHLASVLPPDVPAPPADLQNGVFGPLIPQHPPKAEDEEDEDEEDDDDDEDEEEVLPEADAVELSRKRPVGGPHLGLANGSPAKRPRLNNANGYENTDTATTPMEIDHAENNHAYPSPLEREQAASPIPRTEGPEQGTQIDKVHELGHETYFLRLAPDEAGETSPAQASENPILLHCEWSPRDPSILAAAGTDALARIWTVSRASTAETPEDHVNGISRPYKDLIEDDVPRTSTISALSWNWQGTAIAVATDSGSKARISIWGPDGTPIHHFDVAEPPVIKLRWSPNDNLLLGIAPENGGTLVTVLPATDANSMSYLLRDHDLQTYPLDATWISETEFLLCGGDLLVSLRCVDGKIVPGRNFETRGEDKLSQVQFDWRSRLVATASEKGVIDLWDESGQRRSIHAHLDTITSLQWQPLQSNPPEDERLLASGGEDGAISVWNVRSNDNRPKTSMTMDQAVVALAFTPDGAFIAGATSEKILIWKMGEHAIPRASWRRPVHAGWLSPRMNNEQDEEDTHCLCWDSTGQQLAYGANSRLAVITFR